MSINQDFPTLTPFTFGAMSLGWSPEDRLTEDIAVARMAMDAGVWFHTSQEYGGGGAFAVLRHAFDEERSRTPNLIFKIRCDHAALIRFDVEDALRRLNLERVDIAQLCRSRHDRREVVDDYLRQGPMWETCRQLEAEGKVGRFVLEVFAPFSPDALKAAENDLFDAYIFYFSPMERETSRELYAALEEKKARILSLRTLCGGHMDPERISQLRRDQPDNAHIARFDALEPLFKQSGCANWIEFSMRFLFSIPGVQTTIAGTSKREHLQALLDASQNTKPLDPGLVEEIKSLQGDWHR